MQVGGQDDEEQPLLPLPFLLGALRRGENNRVCWKGAEPALTKAAPGAGRSSPSGFTLQRGHLTLLLLASAPPGSAPRPGQGRTVPVLSKEFPKSSFLPVTTFVFYFIGVDVETKVWIPFEQDPATVWNLFSQEAVCVSHTSAEERK